MITIRGKRQMKICENCGSATFDDMEMCYDCMNSFVEMVDAGNFPTAQIAARLQVTLADYFCYELLLHKLEGRSLSIGSAAENVIVIPQEQVASHQLEVFYAHGQIWAESADISAQTMIDEIPLCGTVRIRPGTEINVGDAVILVLDV